MTLPYVVLCVAVLGAVALLAARARRVGAGSAAPAREGRDGDGDEALARLSERVAVLEEAIRARDAGDSWGPRVDALEQRLRREVATEVARRLAARPAAAPAPSDVVAGPPAAPGLEEALRREGFSHPRLLGPGPDAGTWRVEVERGGIVRKGLARLDAERGLDLDLEGSLRAFP